MDSELNDRGAGEDKPTTAAPSPEALPLQVPSLYQTLPESLEAIVMLAERTHPGAVTSIMILDEAREHLLLGAAPSLPDIYNQTISGSAIGPDANPCGTAAFGN